MADNAFFRAAGRTGSNRLNLIALELAVHYHVDPDVMLGKPISKIIWLQEQTIELVKMQAEERRRQQEEAE
jgi:hypothetical protein